MGKVLEALANAGSLFPVSKQTLYDHEFNPVPDFCSVWREDTKQALGVVGRNYGLVTHEQAFGGVDEFLPELEAKYGTAVVKADLKVRRKHGTKNEVAGSLAGVGVGFPQAADSRGLYPRIILMNGLTGDKGLSVMGGVFRKVCGNGQIIGTLDLRRTLRHTLNVRRRIEGLEAVIFNTMMVRDNMAQLEKASREVEVGDPYPALRFILTGDKEEGDRGARGLDSLVDSYYNAPGADPGTVNGLLQAATFYATHTYGRGQNRGTMFASLSGPASEIRGRALSLSRRAVEQGLTAALIGV